MNYRLLWTHGATATVSFALCWVLTHQSNPSQRVATAAAQTVHSSSSNSTSSQADASEEATTRIRVAKRDKSKKSTEQKISLPLTTIANMIRGEQFRDYFDFHDLQAKMENSLNLLGTSEQEKK